MVKFRGIDISIVSELECRRLPELGRQQLFDNLNTIATCYIPVQPGSQIWFEYSIDGPHPLQASYLFKLVIHGRTIISWDCTSKHDYHGKAAYCLQPIERSHFDVITTKRQTFHFSSGYERSQPRIDDDCIEIRVHRIEYRRRIRDVPTSPSTRATAQDLDVVQLVDAGLLEPGRPVRRYRYQLLDPQDEPYATFRFYCRTYDYLERHNILCLAKQPSSCISASSSEYFDSPEIQPTLHLQEEQDELEQARWSPLSSPTSAPASEMPWSPPRNLVQSYSVTRYPSLSEESLNAQTRDSVEDLPSTVPRSPQSNKSLPQRVLETKGRARNLPPSPTKIQLSAEQKCLPELMIDDSRDTANDNNNNTNEDSSVCMAEKPPSRPLSPFTQGEFLRRLISGSGADNDARPSSAASSVSTVSKLRTNLEDEKQEQKHKIQARLAKTSARRGGRRSSLVGFLAAKRSDKSRREELEHLDAAHTSITRTRT